MFSASEHACTAKTMMFEPTLFAVSTILGTNIGVIGMEIFKDVVITPMRELAYLAGSFNSGTICLQCILIMFRKGVSRSNANGFHLLKIILSHFPK